MHKKKKKKRRTTTTTKKRTRRKSKWENGMHLGESVYGLSTYSYVCTVADEDRRTGAREGEMHHGPSPVLVQPPWLSLSLSLFLLDVFSEHNKQTPPRNLFSYVRGICQSTPLSPPSGFALFFFPFRILSLSHLRQWRASTAKPAAYYVPLKRERIFLRDTDQRSQTMKDNKTFARIVGNGESSVTSFIRRGSNFWYVAGILCWMQFHDT